MLLEEGDEHVANSTPTIRPYGKAMHLRTAKYFVAHTWMHSVIAMLSKSFAYAYRAGTLSVSLLFSYGLIYEVEIMPKDLGFGDLVATVVPIYMVVQNLATIGALLIAVALKWMIMGRRRPGNYNWDENSYCQRWNFYRKSGQCIVVLLSF